MKVKNVKLNRDKEQMITCSKVLGVTANGGNIIASVIEGDKDIKIAIVKDDIPENATFVSTLHESSEINQVFIVEETKKKTE